MKSRLCRLLCPIGARVGVIRVYRLSLLTGLLCCLLAGPLIAQVATESTAAGGDDSNPLQIEDTTQFARPAESYHYLIYDRALPRDGGGLLSLTVKQPLPIANRNVAEPIPISEATIPQHDPDRIPQAYELFRSGKSIVVEGNRVSLRSDGTEQESVLIEGPDVSELRFASKFARTALSPSGRQLAVALLTVQDNDGSNDFPLYDIYVLDLFIPVVAFPKALNQIESGDQHQPKRIREGVRGNTSLGGAFFPHAHAPPLFWADEQTVILATPNARSVNSAGTVIDLVGDQVEFDLSRFEGQVVMKDGELLTPTHDLIGVKVESLATHTFCELKLGSGFFGVQSVDFWRRSDGAIMLRNRGKDMLIDLERQAAIEDRKLSPRYELRGDRFEPALWSGDDLLCDKLYYKHVAVSPDGQCAAWYSRSAKVPNKTNLDNTSQYPTTLWFYSPATGKVAMAEGNFHSQDYSYSRGDSEFNTSLRWLADPE